MRIIVKQPLKDYTSFKIGGPADVFVEPKDIKELIELIKYLKNNNIIYYIIGNGTNLLVSDKGVHGCVIHIGRNLSKIKVKENMIEAEAGALISDIAATALKYKLTGFEELAGIPGSIGGAITMNAGAYGKEMKDVVSFAYAINNFNRAVKFTKDKLDFSYRHSSIADNGLIVTSVTLNLIPGDKKSIEEKMNKYRELRMQKQPLEFPSAGSTFKRPEGKFASQLIQDSNLKGESVGNAEVSEKHAGFIVNKGNATANDVYKLMKKVQDDVKTYFDVSLEPEIKLWGKF